MNRYIKLGIVFLAISLLLIIVAISYCGTTFNKCTNIIFAIAGSQFGIGIVLFIAGLNKRK